MPETDAKQWVEEAATVASTENPLDIPYEVALREALAAAKFVRRYWEADGDRPGLSRFSKRLPKSTSDDIVSLVTAVQNQQTKLLLLVDPVVGELGERARAIIDELESTIAFLLDDGVEEDADRQLAQIKEFHSQDGQRSSALAQSLRNYAALAQSLKERLIAIDSEFDPKLIKQALALADQLVASPAAAAAPDAIEQARATRNRMLHLLVRKVGIVRSTAAHAFRKHPEIVREATSAYERRRRSLARKAAQEKAAAPTGDTSAG